MNNMEYDWQNDLQNRADKERAAREILGVSEDATEIEIKKAFWLQAIENHPDKNPGDDEACERFKDAVGAYEYLTKGESGWIPRSALASSDKMGEYLANEWGYFCWWRDSFF